MVQGAPMRDEHGAGGQEAKSDPIDLAMRRLAALAARWAVEQAARGFRINQRAVVEGGDDVKA